MVPALMQGNGMIDNDHQAHQNKGAQQTNHQRIVLKWNTHHIAWGLKDEGREI